MKSRIMKIVTLLLVASVSISLVACGGGDDKKPKKKSRKSSSASKSTKKKMAPTGGLGPANGTVDLANAGMIKGTVKFAGSAPTPAKLDTSKDKWCAAQPAIVDESLIVSDNGGLRDVLVYIEGLEDYVGDFPEPTEPAKIMQKGCHYVPHVLGVRVGQDVAVVNADDTSHNYHFLGRANDEINRTQPKPSTNIEVFEAAELSASFACDIHPWMNAVVHIMDHPCFTVSTKDGSFTINGVPPGKYKLHFVHASAKTAKDGMEVTVTPKGTATVGDVSFSK